MKLNSLIIFLQDLHFVQNVFFVKMPHTLPERITFDSMHWTFNVSKAFRVPSLHCHIASYVHLYSALRFCNFCNRPIPSSSKVESRSHSIPISSTRVEAFFTLTILYDHCPVQKWQTIIDKSPVFIFFVSFEFINVD